MEGMDLKSRQGKIIDKITHLLYLDDLKLYAAKKAEFRALFRQVEMFFGDVRMSFVLDKCRTICLRRGIQKSIRVTFEDCQTVDPLNEEETYKYLGVQQALSKFIMQLTPKIFDCE